MSEVHTNTHTGTHSWNPLKRDRGKKMIWKHIVCAGGMVEGEGGEKQRKTHKIIWKTEKDRQSYSQSYLR